MSWAVKVDNLSKMYRMGDVVNPAIDGLYHVIEQSISRSVNFLLGKKEAEENAHKPAMTGGNLVVSSGQTLNLPEGYFWALKDVSFEINEGDRVGIIGKNGSGKSTLLKILSRITTPTTGIFQFRGRLVSLLEVGTGFHPDLSGRENIILNARINGMNGKAIKRVFDDIVEFSELGGQIETPIKRYSSGMYMRLAFAVAAHLESEILIVDEVLAVGDTGFQKKCIDKMLEISRDNGRTLLFVSHDMEAVRKLCNRAMLLDHGCMVKTSHEINPSHTPSADDSSGLTSSEIATAAYISSGTSNRAENLWTAQEAPCLEDSARIMAVRLIDSGGRCRMDFDVKEEITIEIDIEVMKNGYPVNMQVYLDDQSSGHRILSSMDNHIAPPGGREIGHYTERCRIYSPLLNDGAYSVEVILRAGAGSERYVNVPEAVRFKVHDDMKPGGVRGNWTKPWVQSFIRPALEWSVEKK